MWVRGVLSVGLIKVWGRGCMERRWRRQWQDDDDADSDHQSTNHPPAHPPTNHPVNQPPNQFTNPLTNHRAAPTPTQTNKQTLHAQTNAAGGGGLQDVHHRGDDAQRAHPQEVAPRRRQGMLFIYCPSGIIDACLVCRRLGICRFFSRWFV